MYFSKPKYYPVPSQPPSPGCVDLQVRCAQALPCSPSAFSSSFLDVMTPVPLTDEDMTCPRSHDIQSCRPPPPQTFGSSPASPAQLKPCDYAVHSMQLEERGEGEKLILERKQPASKILPGEHSSLDAARLA